MNFKTRLAKLREQEIDGQLSAIVVTEVKNREYLCGFAGSAGWLVVSQDKHFVITDGRYWDQVEKHCKGAVLFKFVPAEHDNLGQALMMLLEQERICQSKLPVGLEIDGISLSVFREIDTAFENSDWKITEREGSVLALRECKDDQEVACLRRAAEIADQALASALSEFEPGRTEAELKAVLEYNILKLGGTSTSFPTIIASGPNGSFPHAGASNRKIGESELVTIDFGAVYQGYCSDMTRTIWYGQLPVEQTNLLKHTRIAQESALAVVKDGVRACDVDRAARDYLETVELSQYFVHSLGHGVGLNVHEPPGLRKTNEDTLKTGQVVTIEPGVYVPGFTGCRVEDTVLVTESGFEVLNRFPKQSLNSVRPSTELES